MSAPPPLPCYLLIHWNNMQCHSQQPEFVVSLEFTGIYCLMRGTTSSIAGIVLCLIEYLPWARPMIQCQWHGHHEDGTGLSCVWLKSPTILKTLRFKIIRNAGDLSSHTYIFRWTTESTAPARTSHYKAMPVIAAQSECWMLISYSHLYFSTLFSKKRTRSLKTVL